MSYGIENIEHLETREAFRSRINVYLGSDDTNGMYQALKEIINNSTDEALAGYGKEIDICLDEKTSTIQVRDYGRGVPFGIKEGRNILVAIYTESHTGGKFNKGAYKNSSGLNGLGGTAVCMSSTVFTVQSIRDGKVAEANFKQGILENYSEIDIKTFEQKCGSTGGTGTYIMFKPDKEVFVNADEDYSYDRICSEIKNISYLNKGIKFVVETTQGKRTEFYSKNGIADFIRDKVKSPLMKEPILAAAKDDKDEVEIAFMWSADPTQEYVFVNGLYCPQGGSPITGAKSKITTKIKSLVSKDLSADIIRKGLVFAINCKVSEPSFSDQTKGKVLNTNLNTLARAAFDKGLDEFANCSEFTKIAEIMKRFAKAEKAADRERQKVLNMDKETEKEAKKKSVAAKKLKDCRVHDEKSILYITEGE